jgi:eukaryotic-like serine/threonine-protein kinase
MKTVPHVVQRSEAEATSAIRAAGLTVRVDERRGLNMADGQVVAQDPPGGNQVLEGSTVTVIVARERGGQAKPAPKPGFVLVPNVEGMDEREARRTLEAAGFRVVVRQESSRDRKGQVINQNPEAGNSVRPNVPVTITIGT